MATENSIHRIPRLTKNLLIATGFPYRSSTGRDGWAFETHAPAPPIGLPLVGLGYHGSAVMGDWGSYSQTVGFISFMSPQP